MVGFLVAAERAVSSLFSWRDDEPEERKDKLKEWYDRVHRRLLDETGGYARMQPADAVFIPGLAQDVLEEYKLFDYAADLAQKGLVKHIIYSDRDWRATAEAGQDPSIAGAAWYREALIQKGMKRGMKKEDVEAMLVPAGQEARNTREQTDELVDTAKHMGLTNVIIASVTYHNVRIMSTALASMAERGYSFKAYTANVQLGGPDHAPSDTPVSTLERWVTKSQGQGIGSLFHEMYNDRDRAMSYWENGSPKGDEAKWTRPRGFGAPPEVIEEYLNRRDANNISGWDAYLKKLIGK